MKRILIIYLLCLCLTGCGSDNNKENNRTTEKQSQSQELTTELVTEKSEIEETTIEESTEEITTEATTQVTIETTAEVTTTVAQTTIEQTTEQITTQQSTTASKEQVIKNTFVDLGDSKLNNMCDEILLTILKNDMDERQKAYAIYVWVCDHVRYRGNTAIIDWKEAAKGALSNRKGNCYAFYTASRALLARAGFETGEAVSYGFTHYWNLVKVDGQWRHFDTTSGWGTERFLWTGTQIDEYVYYNSNLGTNITYNWNPNGCPDTN